jgi:signal transduction histidine kinase
VSTNATGRRLLAPRESVTWPFTLPWWWVLFGWLAMIVASVNASPHVGAKVAVGALMTLAAVGMQLVVRLQSSQLVAIGVVVVTLAGLATLLLAHNGWGEVPVFLSVSRFPYGIESRAGRVFIVLDTIAVGVVIAFVSRYVPLLLAGLGVPLLAQRAAEHRELVAERDRAQALLVEVQAGRDAEAQAAALRERGRIARDLHDVLAHSLAGLSLQLQALRAVAGRSGAGPELTGPLDTAAQLARDGLAEARSAVSALRDPIGLGLDAVPAVIARHPGVARLESVGRPGVVSAPSGHAVYRAVQESLTNAARYAPGSAVQVVLTWTETSLRVCIDDDGPQAGHSNPAAQGTGLGLAGMDERVQGAGGRLHTGPRPDAPGWRVEIEVPLESATATSGIDEQPREGDE